MRHPSRKILPALLAGAFWPASLLAAPALDTPLGSHMVIQRDRAIELSGTAAADSSVHIAFDTASITAHAGPDGRWNVSLPAHAPGGPYRLTVADSSGTTALDDILVGDVWLCSGQSNMEFTLRHATNADTEVANADHPDLRLYNVPRVSSPTPRDAFPAPVNWVASTPQSAADFSAACWFMGRDLAAHQHIPIGLIAASWGGSVIEDWISRPLLTALPRYRDPLALLDLYGRDPDRARAQWGKDLAHWLGSNLAPAADAAWRPVPALTFWEQWGDDMAFFDGVGHYRAHITLTPAQAGTGELTIAAADDMDVTSANGVMIGAGDGWNTPRHYPVTLHAGDNVIDVAVVDSGGGGGIWGETPWFRAADGSHVAWHDAMFARGPAIGETGVPPQMPWIGGSGRTTLSNGMIAPLHHFPLAGIAWYQGESNVGDPAGYRELVGLLASDWRARFGSGRPLPLTMVQLANFGALARQPSDDTWGRFRDMQRQIADADPMIGLASAIDVGQPGDIHPTNKQDVGKRLALEARRLTLGEPVTGRGPTPISARAEPGGIRVRFANGPVHVVGAGVAIGFELCAAQCRFVEGRAEGDSVILPADPAANTVRFLWQASPLVNLYGPTDLPASGFAVPVVRQVSIP